MGAWSTGAFGNDAAMDWVHDLEDAEDSGWDLVRETLTVPEGYFEDGEEVLAAAEVIAAVVGNPVGSLPEEIEDWVGSYGSAVVPVDAVLALGALDRLGSDDCELLGLWEDAGEGDTFLAGVEDCRARIVGS